MSSVTTHGLVYIFFTFDCRLVVSRALIFDLTTKVTPLDQMYCYCLINTHTFLCGKSWQGFNGSPWLVSPRLAPHLLRIISIGSLQADGAARGPEAPITLKKTRSHSAPAAPQSDSLHQIIYDMHVLCNHTVLAH